MRNLVCRGRGALGHWRAFEIWRCLCPPPGAAHPSAQPLPHLPACLPQVPFTVVFTKLDKRKKGEPLAEENIAAFEAQVAEVCGYAPPSVLTSSRSGRGRTELLSHVAQLREFFNKTHHGM